MKIKQTAPLVAAIASIAPVIAPAIPVILAGGAALLVLNWLFSDDKAKNKPGNTQQTNPESRDATEATGAAAQIPSVSAVKMRENAIPIGASTNNVTIPLPVPIQRNFITRENMETIFDGGKELLTRKEAIEALKRLGFGKTAAYAALSPTGRFGTWLRLGPNRILTWNG